MEPHASQLKQHIEMYLREIGIRPTTKAYQYLLFALVQLQQDTPFKNSIWELTAIYFGQTRRNVLACVRREIRHAFAGKPYRSISYRGMGIMNFPSDLLGFLRLSCMESGDEIPLY